MGRSTSSSTSSSIVLPSGRVVRVARPGRAASAAGPPGDEPALVEETIRAVRDGRLEVTDGKRVQGEREVLELDLRDFHVLRDAAIRLGIVRSDVEELECENCEATLTFDPGALELSDLSERYRAEAPMPRELVVPLSRSVPIPRGGAATRVRLRAARTLDALPFLRAVEAERFAVTTALVRGMGVVALESDDGARKIDKPVFVARALSRAPDAVWRDVEVAYLEHTYPRAAVAPLVCARCGVLREMAVPWPRELDSAAQGEPSPASSPFLSPEAFEDRVEAIGGEVFAAMAVRNLALRVEPGPADTDLGGEPLLGSYEPRREVDDAGYTTLEFLVTVYYRTFERRWVLEGEYDVDAEIRETIEHEVEHHLHHLAGHDPLDADERREAEDEVARIAGGRKRVRMLAFSGLLGDTWTFARAVGPWAVAAIGGIAILVWLSNWL